MWKEAIASLKEHRYLYSIVVIKFLSIILWKWFRGDSKERTVGQKVIVQLTVDNEVKAVGDAIAGLVRDIKAGKSAIQDAQDAFGTLVGAVGDMASIGADVKTVDNQVYIIKAIAEALEPSAALAPTAASVPAPAAPVKA